MTQTRNKDGSLRKAYTHADGRPVKGAYVPIKISGKSRKPYTHADGRPVKGGYITLKESGLPRKPYTWANGKPNRRHHAARYKRLTADWLKKICPLVYEKTRADEIDPGTLRPVALREVMVRLWHLGFQKSSNLDVTVEIMEEAEVFLKSGGEV